MPAAADAVQTALEHQPGSVRVGLPRWHWAWVLFRFGDGVSHGLVPLVPLLVHDMPLWSVPAVAAAINLVSVPASMLWSRVMERKRGLGRRRLAVFGFASAGIAMAVLAFSLPFWAFLIGAAAYTGLGVATAPAASVLVLESVPGKQWAQASGQLSKRTGLAFLLGGILATATALTGALVVWWAFMGAALFSVAAAVTAAATIPAFHAPVRDRAPRLADVPHLQRRLDRPVWFPARIRFRPHLRNVQWADGDPLRLLVAVFLLFVGSGLFFSAYPGMLEDDLGLAVGWVLLAQLPSNLVTPWAFPWAGRWSARHGDMRAAATGVAARLAVVPALCLVVLFWTPWSLPLLLLVHAAAGASFSFVQVSGSTLMAKSHRGGRGAGIGSYHAAVSMGALVGSVLSFLVLLVASFVWVAVAATAFAFVGGAVFFAIHGSSQFDERNVDG